MRAAHVVLCGASDVSCKATLRAGYEFSNLPTAGGSTAVATGGGGPSNSPTCREPAEVATEIKAMGTDNWQQVRSILRAERQNDLHVLSDVDDDARHDDRDQARLR